MGEVSLNKLFVYYMRKSYIIIAFAIIFAFGGYYLETHVKVPMYKADVSLLLAQRETKILDTNKYYENININKKLVSNYSELLKSKRVLSKVKENLGMNTTVEGLRKKISTWTVEDTSIIYISVTNKKGENAAKIANELANVFKDEIKNIFNIDNVQIIDEADVETKPNNIYTTENTILAGIIGVAVACGGLFLYAFIKSKGDLNTFVTKKKEKKVKTKKTKNRE